MKVDLRNRHAVRMALRFRDELIHRNHVCTHRILQRQMPDDMLDIRHAAVVVMLVVVFMLMRMFVIVVVVMLMLVNVHVRVHGRERDVRGRARQRFLPPRRSP